jgi:hypothetical protein
MMLTVDQALNLANKWRPRFDDPANFETSWQRYMDLVKDQSPAGLEQWLETDQQRDAVRSAGIVKEPALPTRSRFDLRVPLRECPRCSGDLDACSACHGLGYVRRELDIGHPDFGKAISCPRCHR